VVRLVRTLVFPFGSWDFLNPMAEWEYHQTNGSVDLRTLAWGRGIGMKSTSVFKPLCVLITSLVLIICAPQAFARGGGHGGGGFGGGGFHGGGGGFHAGGAGWHGGYGGWRGGGYGGGWGGRGWGGYGWGGRGWGGYGWGGWGPGWGWGFGVGLGWGWVWGSYWGGYPYAYGYPYYPYYPSYYDGPYASALPGAYNTGYGDDSARQYSSTRDWDDGAGSLATTAATRPWRPSPDQLLSNPRPSYRTASLTTQQFAVLRPQARNVMQALQAMPPEARRRQVESGRYSAFSPEEQELFRKAAQLPPTHTAPTKNEGSVKGHLQLAAEPIP